MVAYTSIASGYDASPIPTPNDAIFAGITTAAARIVDPDAYVSPLSNWYFNIASSVLLALVITIVTELVLAKRPGLSTVEEHEEETINLSRKEQIGLRLSGIAFLVILAIVLFLSLPENGPLRGEGGSLDDSPLLNGIAFIIALIFGITGTVYGIKVGKITSAGDVPKLMAEGIRTMAPVLVLFFAIAQFLQYFDWTRIGDVVAVNTAELFRSIGLPIWAVFLLILVVLSIVNVLVTSGSAMWSIMAPVVARC